MLKKGLGLALNRIASVFLQSFLDACNVSIYGYDNVKVPIPFIDDGGNFVPETGVIGVPEIGYRDQITNYFSGVKSSVYWDGVTPATETPESYTLDSDDNYHPTTDNLYLDGTNTLIMMNPDTYALKSEFIEGFEIKPDDAGIKFIGFHSSSVTSARLEWTLNVDGTLRCNIYDNAGEFRVSILTTSDLRLAWHKVYVESFDKGSGLYDFEVFVDGVQEGNTQVNADMNAGCDIDKIQYSGTTTFKYAGFIKNIYTIRKGPGAFTKSPLWGYYPLIGRLKPLDLSSESKNFYDQWVDLGNLSSRKYFTVGSSEGIYPRIADNYEQKEEVFNG